MSKKMDIEFGNMINDDDTGDCDMDDEDIFLNPYNYCDYWCAKCNTKGQCMIYNEGFEADGENMFQINGKNLDNALDMIREYLENNKIDMSGVLEKLDGFDYEAEEDDEEEEEDDDDDDFDYHDEYSDYLDSNDSWEDYEYQEDDDEEDEDDIDAKISQEIETHPLRIMSFDYLAKSAEFFEHYTKRYLTPPHLTDAFSNISWYRTLLPVKMHRTLFSLYEFGAKEEVFHLMDALLTSLIVYKSLRKSLSAVKELKSNLVDYQEMLTELEDILVTMNTGLKHEFPFWIMAWMIFIYFSPVHYVVI